MLYLSVKSDFEYMVTIVVEEAFIFYPSSQLLPFDPEKTIPYIKSPLVKDPGTVFVLFARRVLIGRK